MVVAIVQRMCVLWEVERGTLVELKIRQLKLPRHLYLISRRGTRLSHAALALVRLLRSGHAAQLSAESRPPHD
jgi:hypothetical protein